MLFKNSEKIIENGQTSELKKIRKDVLDILAFASYAVDPYNVVKSRFDGKKIIFESETVDVSGFKNIFLVGLGKASVGMAEAVCDSIGITQGAVITNDSSKKISRDNIATFVGSHPIPDQKSIDATEKVLDVISGCDEEDLLIVLISGGGSSLLCKPRVSLQDLQKTTDLLLKSGADINEINTVRKHLSFVKGGQLVNSASCTVISFIISDIVGDPIEFIASGPTYPDSTTYSDAQKVLIKYDLLEKIPLGVKKIFDEGIKGSIPETLKSDNPVFNNVFNFIVASNEVACKAAIVKAEQLGYETILLTTSLTGEAKKIGKYLVDKAQVYRMENKDVVFILGGETTVKVKGSGKGGRNQEMIIAGVKKMDGMGLVFASFATDGVDGNSDAAGAVADGFTFMRAFEKDMNPEEFLKNNNSYEFFKRLDDVLLTGLTGTNVMDIQVIVKTKQ
jgi:glycerate 2-kinase